MIRINLLQVERSSAATKRRASFNLGGAAAKVPLVCSLILVAAVAYIGYTTWSLFQRAQAVEMELAQAREEELRLQPVLRQYEQFEARTREHRR